MLCAKSCLVQLVVISSMSVNSTVWILLSNASAVSLNFISLQISVHDGGGVPLDVKMIGTIVTELPSGSLCSICSLSGLYDRCTVLSLVFLKPHASVNYRVVVVSVRCCVK
jgi:hypothetical protein